LIPLKDDIPTRRFPVVTVGIIALCAIVYFVFEHGLWSLGAYGNHKVVQYGAIPFELSHPSQHCIEEGQQVVCGRGVPDSVATWVTVFTSMFMHGSFLHLAGNMLFLWIFGNNIEDSMGRPRFVIFYLLGGVAAIAGQTLIDPNAAAPTVGASGAIAAVLGAYALLYPRARVVTLVFIIIFFTILELPALVVLGLWFFLQVAYGASDIAGASGGVAYFAHIGGFIFGLVFIKLFANRVQDDYQRGSRLPVY
jgi:membrane associated rhomboid family serine protease